MRVYEAHAAQLPIRALYEPHRGCITLPQSCFGNLGLDILLRHSTTAERMPQSRHLGSRLSVPQLERWARRAVASATLWSTRPSTARAARVGCSSSWRGTMRAATLGSPGRRPAASGRRLFGWSARAKRCGAMSAALTVQRRRRCSEHSRCWAVWRCSVLRLAGHEAQVRSLHPLLPPLLPRALTCTALPHRRQVRGVVRSSGRAVHKSVRHRGPRPHGRRHYGVPRAERAQRPAQRQ